MFKNALGRVVVGSTTRKTLGSIPSADGGRFVVLDRDVYENAIRAGNDEMHRAVEQLRGQRDRAKLERAG